MKLRNCFACLLLILIGGAGLLKAQKTDDLCLNCEEDGITCVSSEELERRTIFINELYAPSTASLTRIRDKTVFVNILVDTEGKVIKAVAAKGHLALKPIAVAIAYNAEFLPLEVNNKPRSMCGRLILKWNPK